MSEKVDPKPKSNATRETDDKKILAHVEKWMAVIREISRDRPGRSVLSG